MEKLRNPQPSGGEGPNSRPRRVRKKVKREGFVIYSDETIEGRREERMKLMEE